jgi:hypothetical protein
VAGAIELWKLTKKGCSILQIQPFEMREPLFFQTQMNMRGAIFSTKIVFSRKKKKGGLRSEVAPRDSRPSLCTRPHLMRPGGTLNEHNSTKMCLDVPWPSRKPQESQPQTAPPRHTLTPRGVPFFANWDAWKGRGPEGRIRTTDNFAASDRTFTPAARPHCLPSGDLLSYWVPIYRTLLTIWAPFHSGPPSARPRR